MYFPGKRNKILEEMDKDRDIMDSEEYVNRAWKFMDAWQAGDRSEGILMERDKLQQEFDRRELEDPDIPSFLKRSNR